MSLLILLRPHAASAPAVVVTGHYDQPTPDSGDFDQPTPAAAEYDQPTPGAAMYDQPTPS